MRGAPLRIGRHENQKSLGPEGPEAGAGENWASALVKLIPGEVVAAYLAGKSILQGPPPSESVRWLIWTIFCLFAVFGLRRWMTSDTKAGVPAEWSAVFMSMLSFVVWIYSFGDIFKLYGVWDERASGLILIAWTLVAPLILFAAKKLFRE